MGAHANNCDSASYDDLKSSRIKEDLAHTRNPYGSSKWKVPAYHRLYSLHIDYLKTPDGWWIPDFYEFSGEDDKTAVKHISIYLSQLGFAGKEDYMRVRIFSFIPYLYFLCMVYIYALVHCWFMISIRGAIL
jgi:hypothetical protein